MDSVVMTNRQLQLAKNALAALGNRRMANIGADLKVGRLLKQLVPYVEPLVDVQTKAQNDVLAGKDFDALDANERQVFILKMNAAVADVNKESVTVEVNLAYALKEADLPKEQTGTDGWQNATGLGALLADLGPFYVWDDAA